MNDDFDFTRRVVLHPLDLDFALVVRLQDALNERTRGDAKRQLADDQGLVVGLFDAATHANLAAAQSIVVILHVGRSAGREIRVQREAFALQGSDARVDELDEVVRERFARQAHGNPFHPGGEEQGELHGQRLRLLVAAVIALQPRCRLRVEEDLSSEFTEPNLDVTRSGRAVPGEDVSPVSLAVQQQVFLSDLHHGIADGSIPVRVVLHGVTDDVGDLVEPPVVHFVEAVQDAALHRLEAVILVRHGPFEDDVRGVIQEVVVVHPGDLNDPFKRFSSAFTFRGVALLVLRVYRWHFFLAHSSTKSFSTRRFSMIKL